MAARCNASERPFIFQSPRESTARGFPVTVRFFILYGDLEGVGPVHRNGVWAQINAAQECLPVTYLGMPWSGATPPNRCGRLLDAIGRWQPGWAKEICERVRADAEPNGANILLHMVNSGYHMRWADRLAPVWSIFTHRVLYVVDTLQPAYVSPRGGENVIRYYARSASDHTDDWPFWFVADRQKGGLNVTADLIRAHVNPDHRGATLCSREYAEWLAAKAATG